MHVLFQTEFLVALLAVASAVVLIVVFVGRADHSLGDEMAQCVRQSAELLDTCAHSIDAPRLDAATYGDLSGARWRTPERPLRRSHPATDQGELTRIGGKGC